MLSHFKEQKRKAVALIALMAAATVLLYGIAALLLGASLLSPWVTVPVLAIPVFGNLIFNKFEADAMLSIVRMVHLYENDCNPQAFIDEIDPILDTFKPRFDINEVWVLSAYARALVEIGEKEKAQLLLAEFKTHVENSEHPEEKGPLMINYEPLVLMLDGEDAALELLGNAKKAIDDIPKIRKKQQKGGLFTAPEMREDLLSSPDMQSRLMYIEVEKRYLIASRNHDVRTLEKEKRSICADDGASSVLKARYIFALAKSYYAIGDFANAQKEFEEVIRVARGLCCADEARRYIKEIA